MHFVLSLYLLPLSLMTVIYSVRLYRRGRRKTSFMIDMIYAVMWFVWSVTDLTDVWFAPFWVWLFIRAYKRWKNAKDDDDDNKHRAFRTAGSRVKKQLVQKMRQMKPSPVRLPMPQPT